MIVFLSETITTIRAARTGEIQRVSSLCHGALVPTVHLPLPAVLTIGLLTGQTVVLAETPANLVLLGSTLLVPFASFFSTKVTALHGGAHLMAFSPAHTPEAEASPTTDPRTDRRIRPRATKPSPPRVRTDPGTTAPRTRGAVAADTPGPGPGEARR